jgi:hypothetical protein
LFMDGTMKKRRMAVALMISGVMSLHAQGVKSFVVDVPDSDSEYVLSVEKKDDAILIFTGDFRTSKQRLLRFDVRTHVCSEVRTSSINKLYSADIALNGRSVYMLYGIERKILIKDEADNLVYEFIAPEGYNPREISTEFFGGTMHVMTCWSKNIPRDSTYRQGKTPSSNVMITHSAISGKQSAETNTTVVFDSVTDKYIWSQKIFFDRYAGSINIFGRAIDGEFVSFHYDGKTWKKNSLSWPGNNMGTISVAYDEDCAYYSTIHGIVKNPRGTEDLIAVSSERQDAMSRLKIAVNDTMVTNCEVQLLHDEELNKPTGFKVIVTRMANEGTSVGEHCEPVAQLWSDSFWIDSEKLYMIANTSKGILLLEI